MITKKMDFEMESAYEAKKYEDKIYGKWEKSGAFKPKKSKKSYTISMPPPNATGVLHLGHSVMLALEDIMVRQHRMMGDRTLWVPGTDHAAIATQSVVEKGLQAKGMANPRKELGRKKLVEEIRKYAEESKDTIRNQIRKMGASCDWSHERYTLEPALNKAVNTLFQYMYEDGIIYRGGRIVNWDPKMQTTVADDEIEHVDEKAKFYYFQYGPVVIGTARPETKFLDKVIVVHPKDKRYKNLVGKEFELEWIEGKIKAQVIADECIDLKMGTGAMTITPAHSQIDFDLAQQHGLEVEQIIDFDGKIKKNVSKKFGGMPIEEAREKIVEILRKKGLLVKIDEEYEHSKAVNYRGNGTIEPQVMKQWFIDVNKKVIDWKGKTRSIKQVMQDTVKSKMIEIVPSKFEKIYFNWIDNLRDWCISRQIWWGHQIPIWYKLSDEQHKKFKETKDASSLVLNVLEVDGDIKFGTKSPAGKNWVRDPDTLDTWFSASLWTFSTLGWPDKTEDLKRYHPTDVLETGYDIIFFWVARMILASTYALRKEGLPEEKCIPFKHAYLHGLIRERHGKKMSKSNPETCIDPLDMIEKYGTDALRLSMVIGSSPGNDMRLYEEKIAGYRNFINKIWNASRFTLMNVTKRDINRNLTSKDIKTIADKWIITKLEELITEVNIDMEKFRFSDAGNKIYEFIWNNCCDWYVEMSKGDHKNSAILAHVLKTYLKLLHPFVPFVTEAIWENMGRKTMLISEKWPVNNKDLSFNKEAKEMELIQEMISSIRRTRSELKVEPAKKIHAVIYGDVHTNAIKANEEIIMQLARIETLKIAKSGKKVHNATIIIVGKIEVHLPLDDMIDCGKESERISREIANKENYISSVEKKLGNKGFTLNAPKEVIQAEEEKLESEKANLKKLQQQLKNLS